MIHKLVSSKAVIAKVIADLDLKEHDIKISDIRQWIGEAMETIGAVQQLEHKVVILPVNNYLVKLPCDLFRLDQVGFSFNKCHGWLPMRVTTNSFGVFKENRDCCDNNCTRCDDGKCNSCKCEDKMYVHDTELFQAIKNVYNLTSDAEALKILNENDNARQTLSTLINEYTVPSVNGRYPYHPNQFTLQYSIKPGFITVNVPKGFVKISYHAIYTDDDSMPLIPDNQAYFEAIFWYVAMKLMYPKYLKGDLNREIYYDMKRSYNFYAKLAYAEAMAPTTDQLESIKNDWHKLYPEFDMHDEFFESQGDEQIIYNQTNY